VVISADSGVLGVRPCTSNRRLTPREWKSGGPKVLASWRSMRSFGPYGNCARTTEREFRFKRRNVEFIVCSETVPVKENRGLGRLSGGGCRARSSLVV